VYKDLCDRIQAGGLTRAYAAGGFYQITGCGIMYAEEHGIATHEMVRAYRHSRTVILSAQTEVHEANGKLTTEELRGVPRGHWFG
jgi:hypothetical protein